MPIDTADKRASAIHFPLPVPDAMTLNQGDRQQVTWNYRGLLAQMMAPVRILVLGWFTTTGR